MGVLWRLEIGNVLTAAERAKRITSAQLAAFREILVLARSHGLTTHDACYLELASLDKPLVKAARRAGVKTLP